MENQIHLCDYGCGKEAKYYFPTVNKWCCSENNQTCKKNKEIRSISCSGKRKLKGKLFNNDKNIFCDYGCGTIAKFQFKNKKVCCSNHQKSCPNIKKLGRKKKSFVLKRLGKDPDFIRNGHEIFLCDYGCGKEAEHQFKNGKWCCSKSVYSCESLAKSSRRILLIKQNHKGMKGKHHTEKAKNKIRIDHIGKTWNEIFGNRKANVLKFQQQQRCLNGQASYMNSFIQNPSKPQVELFNRVKEIYSTVILNYPLTELNYSLDIAIPDLKIWIESDGSYWHQDKEKDLKRQRKIENLGWKCIRYQADSIKEIPDLEKIKEDIENLKNNIRTNNK